MDEKKLFNVILVGEIKEGLDKNVVKNNLATLFKLPLEKAETLIKGQSLVVKGSVDTPTAAKYKDAIECAGARCRLEAVPQEPPLEFDFTSESIGSQNTSSPHVKILPPIGQDRKATIDKRQEVETLVRTKTPEVLPHMQKKVAPPKQPTATSSTRKFTPQEDEKIYIEGRATYIKSALKVNGGYAFLTSKRFVFSGSNSAISNALSGSPYDNDILFSIPIGDISNVQEGKHGLTKKTIISTKTGDEYSIQFNPHDKWFALIKNPATLLQSNSASTAHDAIVDDGDNWYYEENGKKIGPISSSKIMQFAKNNHTIYRFTKVWRDDMPEWKKAEETELGQYFEGPPPLTGDCVNNTIVWILAFAPIIGVNIESFLAALFHFHSNKLWVITIALNIVLSLLDEGKLNAAGHNTRALGLGSAWLVPVYLFKRAKALKQNLAYFIVWIVSFALVLVF